MEYNNKNIVLNELIGLRVRILSSSDKKERGISGKVIDETKNTLSVDTMRGRKSIIKSRTVFIFYFGKKSFRVKGEEINFRPYERIEKAMKFYKRRSLQ